MLELGFIQEKLTTDSKDGKANYRIEITNATNTAFTARATVVVDFNGNGQIIDRHGYNLWVRPKPIIPPNAPKPNIPARTIPNLSIKP